MLTFTPEQVKVAPDAVPLTYVVPTSSLVGRQRYEDHVPEKLAYQKTVFVTHATFEPLQVAPVGPGPNGSMFLVLDGHHRLWAAQDLGMKVLPVLTATPPEGVMEGRWITTDHGPVCIQGDVPEGQQGCEPGGGESKAEPDETHDAGRLGKVLVYKEQIDPETFDTDVEYRTFLWNPREKALLTGTGDAGGFGHASLVAFAGRPPKYEDESLHGYWQTGQVHVGDFRMEPRGLLTFRDATDNDKHWKWAEDLVDRVHKQLPPKTTILFRGMGGTYEVPVEDWGKQKREALTELLIEQWRLQRETFRVPETLQHVLAEVRD